MGIKGEGGVQDEAKVAGQRGGGDGGVVDGEGDGAGFIEGGFQSFLLQQNRIIKRHGHKNYK